MWGCLSPHAACRQVIQERRVGLAGWVNTALALKSDHKTEWRSQTTLCEFLSGFKVQSSDFRVVKRVVSRFLHT